MKNITDDQFETTIASGTVLVDFYTTWCGPCKTLAPILEKLEKEKKNVIFVKVDIDAQPLHASRRNITSLPTLVLFKNGEEDKRHVGVMSGPRLKEWLS